MEGYGTDAIIWLKVSALVYSLEAVSHILDKESKISGRFQRDVAYGISLSNLLGLF